MQNKRLMSLTESALMAALSIIMSLIIVWKMPQGGSITIGCMLPIVIISIRRGTLWGVLTGVVSGIIQFIITGEAFHPLSVLIDYVLAYGIVGIAGLVKGNPLKVGIGAFIGCAARFIMHLLSGALIFASYAPEGQNPWVYSLLYNGSYMVPETIVTIVEAVLLYIFAKKLFLPKLK